MLTNSTRGNEFPFRLLTNSFFFSYSKGIQTPGRHVRTRLYFTSESHVHSLLSIIRYGGLLNVIKKNRIK